MNVTVGISPDLDVHTGLEAETFEFVNKLLQNPANPSLRIKPLESARDPRVRTGRVNLQYRAVLMEFTGKGEKHFLLMRVMNHDEAIDFATRLRIKTNPINGSISLITDTPSESKAEIAERMRKQDALRKAKEAEEKALLQAQREIEARPLDRIFERGYTKEDLSSFFGLSTKAIIALENFDTEDDVNKALEGETALTRDNRVILGLLAGVDEEEILNEIRGMTTEADPDSQTDAATESLEDDQIIDKVLGSDFWIDPSEHRLRQMIEKGSFKDWRVFLHSTQEKAVKANHKGSARLLGGAGTGKTVVLVHRAKHLLDKSGGKARVLLTTFTRDLARQLSAQMSSLDPAYLEASSQGAPGIWINGIDQLIWRVISNAQPDEVKRAVRTATGLDRGFVPRPVSGNESRNLWNEAIALHGDGLDLTKKQIPFLEDELNDVILGNGITEQAKYLRVARTGRGTQLGRNERKIVWNIVQSYLTKCARIEKLPFPAIAMVGAVMLELRQQPFIDHAVIDEAQDFHAGHWRFIRAVVAPGPNDIYLAEDSHQRIYGHRLVLSRFGIETRGRATQRLTLNYRTTAENLKYASAILEGVEWVDSAEELDTLTGYRSLRKGPAPRVIQCTASEEEYQLIADTLKGWIEDSESRSLHIGVLARTRDQVVYLTSYLEDRDIHVSNARSGQDVLEAQVSVLTMHNAKGMEFTHVVLADVSEDAIPRMAIARDLAEAERNDALQRERALLYVAASRARDELVITVSGKPSELLPQ